MNIQKYQKMDMYLKNISIYSNYVNCLTRVIKDFIENENINIKHIDAVYIAEILENYTNELHTKIMSMKSSWEFD